jgi:hypothetical protein
MHRLRLPFLVFLAGLLLGSAGCAVSRSGSVVVGSIYVEDAVGAPTPDLARCHDVIHDESVRVLRARGFLAASEPAAAEGLLRAVWFAHPAAAGKPAGRVSLRMTLEDRDGRELQSFEVITEASAGFLTKERIADLVRTGLSPIRR